MGEVGFFAVVVESEECGAALDLRLHHAGRRDFEAAGRDLLVCLTEGAEERRAHFEHRRRDFAAEDQVPVVIKRLRVRIWSHARGDGFLVADRLADDFVVIGVKFSVVGRVLLRGDFPHLAEDLNRRLQRQRQGVVGADEVACEDTLQEPIAI